MVMMVFDDGIVLMMMVNIYLGAYEVVMMVFDDGVALSACLIATLPAQSFNDSAAVLFARHALIVTVTVNVHLARSTSHLKTAEIAPSDTSMHTRKWSRPEWELILITAVLFPQKSHM